MKGDVSNGGSRAGSSSVVSGLAGVRCCVVGDTSGNVIQTHGDTNDAQRMVAVSTEVARSLAHVGTALRIGVLSETTLRASDSCWVVGFHDTHAIVVDVELSARIATIEQAVGLDDWIPRTAAQASAPNAELKPTAKAVPKEQVHDGNSADAAQAKPTGAQSVSPAPETTGQRRTVTDAKFALTLIGTNLANANARGLRRALARGDLATVREIAEHLKNAYAPPEDRCCAGPAAQALETLMVAIGAVLSGDSVRAMQCIESVCNEPSLGLSLSWSALHWRAKASLGTSGGLNAALNYAKEAAQVSRKLDEESRAISARLLAELYLERPDPDKASKFFAYYLRFLESLQSEAELAEARLLEAKLLYLNDDRPNAAEAAQHAHETQPEWPAPIALLCRLALDELNVQRGSELLQTQVSRELQTPELSRIQRLLAESERGAIDTGSIAEFLRLTETLPSRESLSQLKSLCQQHSRIEPLWEMLGWQLLLAGNVTAARNAFAQLETLAPLPNDAIVSLFLALGCLAAIAPEHLHAGARLRATVNAAPQHLRTMHSPSSPAATSDAPPLCLADFARPHALLASFQSSRLGSRSPLLRHGQPRLMGAFHDFNLQALLAFLSAGRCTGVLVCAALGGVGAIEIREGAIIGAMVQSTPRLGDTLIDSNHLSKNLIQSAVEIQASMPQKLPIGTILVQKGWLSREGLENVLIGQAEHAINELLNLSDGLYAFNPQTIADPTCDAIEVAIDV